MKTLIFLSFLLSYNAYSQDKIKKDIDPPAKEIVKASNELFGTDPRNKFSLYQPAYFIFGKDDLKLQFSAKYRVAKSYNLYLGYTQTMFWNIYDTSAPFDDINYGPEAFYRLVERESSFLKSVDFGFSHLSNGVDSAKSRSINRIFLKNNFMTNYKRNNILGELKLHHIYSKSSGNEDIVDYLGYWDLRLTLTHIVIHGTGRLDAEFRVFAGKQVLDFGKGGREVGLIYRFGSENFNPALYMQYYTGYGASLLHYNQKSDVARLGFLLFY